MTGRRRVRDSVPVNVTVPAVGPEQAHAIVLRGGCRTAKVKVAEPGQTLADDQARLEAVRDAIGPDGRIRIDVNGLLGRRHRDRAHPRARARRRRPGVRRAAVSRASRTSPPYGGPSTSRSRPTSRSAGPPTPTGCATSRPPTSPCSRCSRSAACAPACGSPRTSGCRSSCRRRLETSVGIAAGVALAAALPELPYACGLATVQLLDARRRRPSRCCRSTARCRCGCRSSTSRWCTPTPDRVAHWEARLAEVRALRQDRSLVSCHRRSPAPSSRRWSRPASPRSWSPRARATPRSRFAAYDAAAAGLVRLHTRIDERTAGFLALGLTKNGNRAAVDLHVRHRRRQPAPGRARGRARRAAAGRRHRRPAGAAARHQRQPDHRPGRHLRPAGRDPGRRPATLRPAVDRAGAPQRPARRAAAARRPLGRRTSTPGRAPARRAPLSWSPSRRARAPSWSPATTPGRRRGCSPSGPAGRCSPSRPAARAPAPTRSAPTGCCSPASSATAIERVVVCGHPTLSRPVSRLLARDDVEVVDTPRRGVLDRAAVPGRRAAARRARRRAADDPAWLEEWHAADAGVGRQLDALLAAEPDLTPHEVAGAVAARAARPAGCSSSARPARSATST